MRTVADLSADADPNTGVAVYDSYQLPGWLVAGGTSASAPFVAAGIALAGNGATIKNAAGIYRHTAAFNDVVGGTAGGAILRWRLPLHGGPGLRRADRRRQPERPRRPVARTAQQETPLSGPFALRHARRVSALEELGLNDLEETIYLATLDRSKSSVDELAEVCDTTRPKTSRVLTTCRNWVWSPGWPDRPLYTHQYGRSLLSACCFASVRNGSGRSAARWPS